MPDPAGPFYNHSEQIDGKIRVRLSTSLRIEPIADNLDSSWETKS